MILHNEDAEVPNCQPVSGHGVSLHLGMHLMQGVVFAHMQRSPTNNASMRS
jgi:hypothetical protein